MRKPGHIWHRPVSRTYAYNLDLGENYYQPIRDFVERKARSLSPGALDFGERLVYCRPKGRRCGDVIESRSSRASPFEESDCTPPPPIRAGASLPLSAKFKGFPDKGFQLRQLEAAQVVARAESKAAETVAQELASSKTAAAMHRGARTTSASSAMRSSQVFATSKASLYGEERQPREPLRYNEAIQPKTTHAHEGGSSDVPSYNRYHTIKPHARDDISKKVADIHMAPFKYGEAPPPAPLQFQAKWNQVNQLEEELGAMMAYWSSCAKAKALVAEEALSADANTRKMKTTVVESVNRRRILV